MLRAPAQLLHAVERAHHAARLDPLERLCDRDDRHGRSLAGGRRRDGPDERGADERPRPVVDEVLPLSEIRRAHERLEAGEQLGKIVLTIPA